MRIFRWQEPYDNYFLAHVVDDPIYFYRIPLDVDTPRENQKL